MLNLYNQNYFKRALKIFIFSTVLLIVTAIVFTIFSPSLETFKNIGDKVPQVVNETEGLAKVWQYIIQNGVKVPLQMMVFALIPIPFLYLVNLISTEITFGIVIGVAFNFVPKEAPILVLSNVPHYTFEVFALCLIASGLLLINKSILRKLTNLFRKEKKVDISFRGALSDTIKIYLFLTLPLIIIAAFLETYFTEFFMNLFIK